MGRKLDLSQLSDAEARHVWTVVQRDLSLRRKDQERLRALKDQVQHCGSAKRVHPGPDPGVPSEITVCAFCPQPLPAGAQRGQCLDCLRVSCEGCGRPEGRGWLCQSCQAARSARLGSLDWFYGLLRTRFKSLGSDKVRRSLAGRLQAAGEPQPSPGERSEDSELTDEDKDGGHLEAQAQPLGSRPKRRLSVHDLDIQLDSDDSAGSWGSLPSPGHDPAITGSPQPSTGEPSSEEAVSQDTLVPEEPDDQGSGGGEEQLDRPSPPVRDTPAELDLPGVPHSSAPEGDPEPGSAGLRREQPLSRHLADADTSDGDSTGAQRASPHHSSQRKWPPDDSQIPELNQRLRAVDHLLTRLEHAVATTPAQVPTDRMPSEADLEEAALKRKLEQLARPLSERGASSEEDQEDWARLGGVPIFTQTPKGPPGARPTSRQEQERQWPMDPGQSPGQELSRLEDSVATAAERIQQAEAEVSHIQSRIAALQAAGLTVTPSATPQRRRSNLPVLLPRLAGRLSQCPQDPDAKLPKEGQVPPVSYLPRRAPTTIPRRPGEDGDAFDRQSVSRGSLTQRSPNGKRGPANHGFAKPVMTQKP